MANVYVIGPERGPYKIGVANDLKRRIAMLQTSASTKLKLHFSRECRSRESAYAVEFNSHRHLTEFRKSGEWFSCALPKAIEAVKSADANKIVIPKQPKDRDPIAFCMTPADFTAFVAFCKERHGWKKGETATRLGIHANRIADYSRDGADLTIALACAAIAEGLAPWPEVTPKKRAR